MLAMSDHKYVDDDSRARADDLDDLNGQVKTQLETICILDERARVRVFVLGREPVRFSVDYTCACVRACVLCLLKMCNLCVLLLIIHSAEDSASESGVV